MAEVATGSTMDSPKFPIFRSVFSGTSSNVVVARVSTGTSSVSSPMSVEGVVKGTGAFMAPRFGCLVVDDARRLLICSLLLPFGGMIGAATETERNLASNSITLSLNWAVSPPSSLIMHLLVALLFADPIPRQLLDTPEASSYMQWIPSSRHGEQLGRCPLHYEIFELHDLETVHVNSLHATFFLYMTCMLMVLSGVCVAEQWGETLENGSKYSHFPVIGFRSAWRLGGNNRNGVQYV
jgi:hypothetical protein